MSEGGAPADVGHNHPPVAVSSLQSIVERVERLNMEKAEVAEQIKEVFAEAKGNGFDVKVLRKIVALRARDRGKVAEELAVMRLYAEALGCADLV